MRTWRWGVSGFKLFFAVLAGASCSGMISFSAGVHAAGDYEYARGLLKMQSRSFKTNDLVQHLIERLDKSPRLDAKLESKLIAAALYRKQFRFASVERQSELLKKVGALYDAFLAKGKNHRLYQEALRSQATIQVDAARALIKAADENPTGHDAERLKAVAIFEKIADLKYEESQKARPAFDSAVREIQKWLDEHPDAQRAPPRLITVAQKALNAYIPRDKLYIVARMEQLGAYPDGPLKITKTQELIAYCKTQIESDTIGQLSNVVMWYQFIQGRLHSNILEEEKAVEVWRLALDIDLQLLSTEAKKTVYEIKGLICRDLIKMRMKLGEKNPTNYQSIIEIFQSEIHDPDGMRRFSDPVRKQVTIDYAHALTLQDGARTPDFVRALKVLTQIVKEGLPWSNNASRAMAKLLLRARSKEIKLHLSAEAWYAVARGFFLDGQVAYVKFKEHESGDRVRAQTHYKVAFEKYENAVTYYRLAIEQARRTNVTPLAIRLKIEPLAWFEMGLAYLKMKRYRESVIAYLALEGAFLKESRVTWMPDHKTNTAFYKNKAIRMALVDLDKVDRSDVRKDGILSRTKRNIKIGASLLGKEGTRWAKTRKFGINARGGGLGVDPESNDRDYQAARLEMDAAKDLVTQGNEFLSKKKTQDAEAQYLQALTKFERAGTQFGNVKKTSPVYEVALYQAASCITYAQSLVVNKRKIVKAFSDDARTAKSLELGGWAIKAYDAYEARVAADKANGETFAERRIKLGRGARLNRTTVFYSMKDWKGVLKACEEFLAYEQGRTQSQVPDTATVQKVYFNMYRAYSYLAGGLVPPACDSYLEKAAALLPRLESNKKYLAYALQNLSLRYNNAAAQAEKASMDRAILLKYEALVATFQAKAMKLKDAPVLEDYVRLLYLHERAGDTKEAADIAAKLLARFDPEQKNKRVDDAIWKPMLAKMNKIIKYADLNKWSRCKKDHAVLLDFIYDTQAGLRFGHDQTRKLPAEDKHPVDLEKALAKVKTIRKNYPNCPTVKPVAGVTNHWHQKKGYLDFIQSEIDFRRQIVATRDILSTVAFDVALELDKKEGMKAEANRYRKMAEKQITILLKVYGEAYEKDFRVVSNRVNIKIANGNFDGAIKVLNDVKREERPTSKLYIQASIKISEIKYAKKDYEGAARYPIHQANTVGLKSIWVQKWWPGMEAFLENCYSHREVQRPRELVVDRRDAMLFEAQTEDEKKLEGLERIKKRAMTDPSMKSRLITPMFVFEYKFFHGKVAHFNESKELERILQFHRGEETEKDYVTVAFKARYRLVNELVDVESRFWRALQQYNSMLVKYKGVNKVPPKYLKAKNELKRKVDGLRDELKKTKKIKSTKKMP